jgi:hypothetical protein
MVCVAGPRYHTFLSVPGRHGQGRPHADFRQPGGDRGRTAQRSRGDRVDQVADFLLQFPHSRLVHLRRLAAQPPGQLLPDVRDDHGRTQPGLDLSEQQPLDEIPPHPDLLSHE